mgnify:CR=1 FL=1
MSGKAYLVLSLLLLLSSVEATKKASNQKKLEMVQVSQQGSTESLSDDVVDELSDIEEIVDSNKQEEVVLITSDSLEDTIDELEDLDDQLDSDSEEELIEIVESKIQDRETQSDYLEDEDLVQLVVDGSSYYVDEDEFESEEDYYLSGDFLNPNQGSTTETTETTNNETTDEDVLEQVEDVENLAQANQEEGDTVITPEDLDEAIKELEDVDDELDSDESVTIGPESFDNSKLKDAIEDREEYRNTLEDNDDLGVITANNGVIYVDEGTVEEKEAEKLDQEIRMGVASGDFEYLTLEDIDDEIEYLESTRDDLDEGDVATIDGQEYTAQDIDDEISELEGIRDEVDEDDFVLKTSETYKVVTQEDRDESEEIIDETGLPLKSQYFQEEEEESISDTQKELSESTGEKETDASSIEEVDAENQNKQETDEMYKDVEKVYSYTETSQEYTDRISTDQDYDEDVPVFSTNWEDSEMIGDDTNNASSDLVTLTKVAPEENGSISWSEIDNEEDIEDSDNPNAKVSFLQDTDNPLDRDDQAEPESSGDEGDDYMDGELEFLLATSFIENEEATGKVFVIPADEKDRDSSYELIGGLQRPTGICFDVNHDFLYVVENGLEGENGFIYQYEIDWDDNDKFTLARNIYVVVFEGTSPQDCKIDEYGNMFFVESSENQINMISYLDLYSGFKNKHYTIYEATDSSLKISTPVALDVIESKDIYFVNNENGADAGTVNQADAQTDTVNGKTIEVLVRNNNTPWGVTYTDEELVFFSLDNGEVWAYDTQEEDNNQDMIIKSANFFKSPRGVCYGDGNVYVADYEKGGVYQLSDNSDENEVPEEVIMIQGVYNMFCVNGAGELLLSVFMVLAAFI